MLHNYGYFSFYQSYDPFIVLGLLFLCLFCVTFILVLPNLSNIFGYRHEIK